MQGGRYYRVDSRYIFISETMNAKRLINKLLDLTSTKNSALIDQLANLTIELKELQKKILAAENKIDDFVYSLYKLNCDEIKIIVDGTEKRTKARMPG